MEELGLIRNILSIPIDRCIARNGTEIKDFFWLTDDYNA